MKRIKSIDSNSKVEKNWSEDLIGRRNLLNSKKFINSNDLEDLTNSKFLMQEKKS